MSRYAVILGGELRNRGAQAMTFRAIAAVRELLPGIEPVVASNHDAPLELIDIVKGKHARPDQSNLAFDVIRFDVDLLYGSSAGRFDLSSALALAKTEAKGIVRMSSTIKTKRILDEAALCIDISGFAFGAQWSFRNCQRYLNKLELLRERGIPTYIMPQSFGPFEFADPTQTETIRSRAAELLLYPRMICAREQQGFADMKALCPGARLSLEEDLVLAGGPIDPASVFVDPSVIPPVPSVGEPPLVGIVPNRRTFDHGDETSVLTLWGLVVEELLSLGYRVCIIRHAEDDGSRCRQIKALFEDNARVSLLKDELYCFQYEDIFSRCDFLVASRFHAIVHAYRCGVPCVVLGWATKYEELLERFAQESFVHDVRNLNDTAMAHIVASVRHMANHHDEESTRIATHLAELHSTSDVFERLAEDYGSIAR
ncbi:MAG: polysaccharide pyruvyl transferase family protein [Atopobiaceae bacterium]|nr:polysaccharide pyruvyl transferase family protein [Atopobiaceae bacterium]